MKKIFLSLAIVLMSIYSNAQGCSDAGFCSIGSFKNTTAGLNDKSNTSLTFGSAFGIGEHAVFVTTPYIQLDKNLKKDWQIQAKTTYNKVDKYGYSVSGLGDAYVTGIKFWNNKHKGKNAVNFGIKFPLNNADNKSNGTSLPLAYQTTLETTDLIIGYVSQRKTWSFAAAAQIPLVQNNSNSFISPTTDHLKSFVSTRQLNRKTDVLLRATKKFEANKSLVFRASGLIIYHTGNDSYTDLSNNKIEIKESNGLTLNFNAGMNYKLSNKLSLDLLVGIPLVVRTIRPDGLTRSFVIVPELKWNF
jgi:hypothetical protein